VLLAGAITAVFLAGGPQEGNLGAFLIIAGLALVVCPPQIRVEPRFWWIAIALVLAASMALLPHGWWPEPGWRQRLIDAGVPLANSLTPVPRETWFWLEILIFAVCTALFALSHPIRSRSLLSMAVAAIVLCGLYAGLSIYARQTGWEYRFDADPADFGFFLNRNHTAAFLVTGSVLALGVLGVAFRRHHWLECSLAAIGLTLCASGLFLFTTSRGGVMALVAGTVLWLAGLGHAHRSRRLLISFGAVLGAATILFFSSGSAAQERLFAFFGSGKNPAPAPSQASPESVTSIPDARVLIFSDTLNIIRDYPLTGSGLGTFRYVFPFYRARFAAEMPVAHPESDWLMLAAEAGPPALAILGLGLGFLLRRSWRLREHPYWPLRWGILCAALAALLHGFVDVPAHRTALGWWILVIAGLGFQHSPREVRRPPLGQYLLFICAGFGAITLGVGLVRAEWFNGPPSPPYAGLRAQPEIMRLRIDGRIPEAVTTARAAIQESPMTERLYFQLGVALLKLESHNAEAESALRVQRLLLPYASRVAVEQGDLWKEIDPKRAAALWSEALEIRERTDRRQGTDEKAALGLFTNLIASAATAAEAQRQLLGKVTGRPEFVLTWLERAAPDLVTAEFSRLAADPAFSKNLSGPQRRSFLESWYTRGDRSALFAFVAEHPEWQQTAAPLQLRHLADSGQFEEAIRLTIERYRVSLDLPTPGASAADASSSTAAGPLDVFREAWRKGNTVTALRVLKEARKETPVDPETLRLLAALSARDGKWPEAWRYLDQYVRAAGLDAAR
jgi:tetratricopeptide (TPR) repeat protein